MKYYADKVHADLVILEGYASQPYVFANKFRVRQVFDEYGYDSVLYVDGDILITPDCINFFEMVPDDKVAILDEGPYYDYWMLAHYRHEALELIKSQGLDHNNIDLPTPKNAGLYLMRKQYKDTLKPLEKPFPLCYRNGTTVEQTWFCLMLQRHNVPLHFLKFPEHHWLWYLDQDEKSIHKGNVLHFCGLQDQNNKRYDRLLANSCKFVDESEKERKQQVIESSKVSCFDSQMILSTSALPGLNMRDNFVIRSHQYGWEVALKTLSVLFNPEGVLFDGFIEQTFLWDLDKSREKGKIPYCEPWVGFIHHPPNIPNWASIAKHRIQGLNKIPEWSKSLENCLGLFALTDYLAEWVRNEWKIDCDVLRYAALMPDNLFSFEKYESQDIKIVTMIGFWLRRYSSFRMLEAKGHRKVRPLLVDDPNSRGMDHIRVYEKEEAASVSWPARDLEEVEIITRLSNSDYDDLLSKSVVFLDLLDASAATTIIECIARCTPLLINPLPGVKEYLGEDYPLYFESLEEASRKLQDSNAVLAAHKHMTANPIRERLQPQRFLDELANTHIYQKILWALTCKGNGSSAL